MKKGTQVLQRPFVSHCTIDDTTTPSSVMIASGRCRFGTDGSISYISHASYEELNPALQALNDYSQ